MITTMTRCTCSHETKDTTEDDENKLSNNITKQMTFLNLASTVLSRVSAHVPFKFTDLKEATMY